MTYFAVPLDVADQLAPKELPVLAEAIGLPQPPTAICDLASPPGPPLLRRRAGCQIERVAL
jgi:hypothetical protein